MKRYLPLLVLLFSACRTEMPVHAPTELEDGGYLGEGGGGASGPYKPAKDEFACMQVKRVTGKAYKKTWAEARTAADKSVDGQLAPLESSCIKMRCQLHCNRSYYHFPISPTWHFASASCPAICSRHAQSGSEQSNSTPGCPGETPVTASKMVGPTPILMRSPEQVCCSVAYGRAYPDFDKQERAGIVRCALGGCNGSLSGFRSDCKVSTVAVPGAAPQRDFQCTAKLDAKVVCVAR